MDDNRLAPEIEHLKIKVAEKFAHKLATTNDFDLLSMIMERELNECVSSTTLKRMWSYVNLHPTPREATLDILSRYVGNKNFKDFCENLKAEIGMDSDFYTTKCITASDLNEKDLVIIGWDPNRYVTLEYEGDCKFKVTDSVNSKFEKNDVFETSCFMMGDPLILSRILRKGEYTSSFIAGRKGGLRFLKVEKA